MTKQDQRLDRYLSTYQFHTNSIDFRIISSMELEKFKNVQAFQLNQLVRGNFSFSKNRRELLLLKYDMWFRWLTEVESYFIQKQDSSACINQYDIDFLVGLADKTVEKYIDVITNAQVDHFDQEFSKIWLEVHELAYNYLVKFLLDLKGSYEECFIIINTLLIEALQYTLVEIHELNETFKMCKLSGKDKCTVNFIVITDYSLRVAEKFGVFLTPSRLGIYKKYFNVDTIWIKNYTDRNIPEAFVENITKMGIQIDYLKTLCSETKK